MEITIKGRHWKPTSSFREYAVERIERLTRFYPKLIRAELVMTQELMANMLGVRREGVTEAAGNLQNAGLIKYSRGRITELDRAGLEARTCECYAVVKKEFARLLPHIPYS